MTIVTSKTGKARRMVTTPVLSTNQARCWLKVYSHVMCSSTPYALQRGQTIAAFYYATVV